MNMIAARGIILAPPSLLTRMRMKLAQAADQWQTSNLDDRLLRDIGVTRADIEIRGFLE
ncbi:DUF1127 domain-containing protein [Taklimakanibacter lacteus]|uniref:DUF1127 domain-containing protein n=1 Tax=Taklimakanibacter lacteus TaxID=2268456 RepID=UPI0013C43A51